MTVNPDLMFTEGYGYLSGLNPAMSDHLHEIVSHVLDLIRPSSWIDIGCNDGTLLQAVPGEISAIGFDPVARPVPGRRIVKDYFSMTAYWDVIGALDHGHRHVDVITSIAMFYDLDDPIAFADTIRHVLSPHGIWVLEVGDGACLPENWDGICHEHLTYYTEADIENIMRAVGMRVFLFRRNDVNGGSIQAWICHSENTTFGIKPLEVRAPAKNYFRAHINRSIESIREAVHSYDVVDVYGASTKGNTLLQACKLKNLRFAAERNPEKVGRFTPGTRIRIVSEAESRANPPDAYLVLPWHFKQVILQRERAFKGDFIFPLPEVEIE